MPEMTCLADGKNGACGWFNDWSMGDYIEFVYAATLRAAIGRAALPLARSRRLRCAAAKKARTFVRNRQAPTDGPESASPP